MRARETRRLTDAMVSGLQKKAKRYLVYEQKVPGLLVRIEPTRARPPAAPLRDRPG